MQRYTSSHNTIATRCPISVLIPTRNEEHNLQRCLHALSGWADEIVVVDSQSTDRTLELAVRYGAQVLQFYYQGGWPKKRNWALETYPWRNNWILLLDADEVLLEPLKLEIAETLASTKYEGYELKYQVHFLGRRLRFGGTQLRKLALFRRGLGRYERRLECQDASMGDMEVHEQVILAGRAGRLRHPVQHANFNSLERHWLKHHQYANWEARVLVEGARGELQPSWWGNQAQRRRWLKQGFLRFPGSPVAFFVWRYLVQLGFLDGVPGLIYSFVQTVYLFEVKAKAYELRLRRGRKPFLSW